MSTEIHNWPNCRKQMVAKKCLALEGICISRPLPRFRDHYGRRGGKVSEPEVVVNYKEISSE